MTSIKIILRKFFKKPKLVVSFFLFLRKFVAYYDVASLQGQIQKNIEGQFLYSVKNNAFN